MNETPINVMDGIGFCGSHRTGKTTLAKELAKRIDVEYIDCNVSGVFKKYNCNANIDYDIQFRMMIQHEILNASCELWDKSTEGVFTTDRTPVDFLAYMLLSIKQDDITPEVNEALMKYREDCKVAAAKYFGNIFEVLPAIVIQPSQGKANLEPANILRTGYMMRGIMDEWYREFTPIELSVVPPRCTEVEGRVNFCYNILKSQRRYNDHGIGLTA